MSNWREVVAASPHAVSDAAGDSLEELVARLDTEGRATCRQLAESFGVSTVVDQLAAHPGSVPIGIEVEVPWRTYFPDLWLKYGFDDRKICAFSKDELEALTLECSIREQTLLPRLRRSVECGIPRGADRYWEFAARPVFDTVLLGEKLRLLTAAGLLPRTRKHSLQVSEQLQELAENPALSRSFFHHPSVAYISDC